MLQAKPRVHKECMVQPDLELDKWLPEDNQREAFTVFLHPEEFEHMKEIVVWETLEDINKNEDGFVDQDEYIVDMFSHENNIPESDWVLFKQEQFNDF
ncbi:hypothetical protein A6R68_01729 [Neotoma lepida]|uniref:EF-hand domain-containing protein n=1 Tax=Neotoma lepida TaxID=56216 RepID=A0A1A6GVS6_NEOLE|nr:hypothetical protein A6R68_01729 [Neotoma lepida]